MTLPLLLLATRCVVFASGLQVMYEPHNVGVLGGGSTGQGPIPAVQLHSNVLYGAGSGDGNGTTTTTTMRSVCPKQAPSACADDCACQPCGENGCRFEKYTCRGEGCYFYKCGDLDCDLHCNKTFCSKFDEGVDCLVDIVTNKDARRVLQQCQLSSGSDAASSRHARQGTALQRERLSSLPERSLRPPAAASRPPPPV